MKDDTDCKRSNLTAWLTSFSNSNQVLDESLWPDYTRFIDSYSILRYTFGVFDDNNENTNRPVSKTGNCQLEMTFESADNPNLKVFLAQRYSCQLFFNEFRHPERNYIL